MIRRARGDPQDLHQLVITRPGSDHFARAARAAGFKQAEDGRTIVEHHGLSISRAEQRNNRLHKQNFAVRVPPT